MESIWKKTVTIVPREALAGDTATEVVVIGAGMAGVLIAAFLKREGMEVVVLEANRIGSGQTENTTAKIALTHHCGYSNMMEKFGNSYARQYANAQQAAIEAYAHIIQEKGIECEFRRCASYLYTQIDAETLEKEAAAAERLGIKAELTVQTELPIPVKRALKFDDQAAFHPLSFLNTMAEEIIIYEQTRVEAVKGGEVITSRGKVTARYVVFACHFPFMNIPGYYFMRMHQERSYVLALQGVPVMDGMYLGIDHSGLSFRQSGNYMLLGGGSHRTGENQFGGSYEHLRTKSKAFWPESKEVAAWSAQDCVTLDAVPYIGRYAAGAPQWYVATGFGKWGMTSSMVAATLITDLISGKESPYEEVFSPQRFEFSESAKNMVDEGLHAVKGLAGTGEIRCRHMGCQVEWNPDEQSYDCPCHGSRYSKDGELLDGPAQEGLKL